MTRAIKASLLAFLLPFGLSATAVANEPDHNINIVVHGTSTARAREIEAFAERTRREIFRQVLGVDEPLPWIARCAVHVHTSPAAFAAALGAAPTGVRGATSIDFSADAVKSRRIDVVGDGPDMIPDALAHELVHVVLADHFVHAPPPRWADEGLAVLFDSSDKQVGHEQDFRSALDQGFAFSAAELVALDHIPSGQRRQQVFYGQSAAVVRWLINRRDAATFIRFVDDIDAVGFTPALKRHYDLDSVAFLASAWKEVHPIQSLSLNNRKRDHRGD